jgi:LPS O-antigen subunit length determinant protein (WzzB/FepE family)
MGGKAALAANYLTKWFSGLWQGESFAYTVAFITFAIAVGYYFIASDTSMYEEENTSV